MNCYFYLVCSLVSTTCLQPPQTWWHVHCNCNLCSTTVTLCTQFAGVTTIQSPQTTTPPHPIWFKPWNIYHARKKLITLQTQRTILLYFCIIFISGLISFRKETVSQHVSYWLPLCVFTLTSNRENNSDRAFYISFRSLWAFAKS